MYHRRMAILRTFAVGSLVVALGSAIGANTATVASASATQESGASAAQNATAHVELSGVAASVIDLLTGGSNPSAVSHRGGESANVTTQTQTEADEDNDADETNDTAANLISPSQTVHDAGTSGARPGFGCGDKNHEHSGPPGRPGASLPPGCAKH